MSSNESVVSRITKEKSHAHSLARAASTRIDFSTISWGPIPRTCGTREEIKTASRSQRSRVAWERKRERDLSAVSRRRQVDQRSRSRRNRRLDNAKGRERAGGKDHIRKERPAAQPPSELSAHSPDILDTRGYNRPSHQPRRLPSIACKEPTWGDLASASETSDIPCSGLRDRSAAAELLESARSPASVARHQSHSPLLHGHCERVCA